MATLAAAVNWKRDTERAFAAGRITPGRAPKLKDAAVEWLELAEQGVVLTRGGRPYRPSTLRGYRQAMSTHLDGTELGDERVDQITPGRINRHVESLQRLGLAPQTVKNVIVPVRAIYRRLSEHEIITRNPTTGARVPAGSGRRLAFLSPAEISPVLDALDVKDRALWATAIYAGLRRGELMALPWSDVDLGAGVITVRWAYDQPSKTTGPVKSSAGQDRRIPIVAALRDHLVEHRHRAGGRATGLVFARGRLAGSCRAACRALPFADQAVSVRAQRAWNRAGVRPVTLHNCRHTFASLMIAAMAQAGTFDPKTIQQMLGHASIVQTYDTYGHLFPGSEANAGRMLDGFLAADHATGDVERAVARLRGALADADPAAVLPAVTEAEALVSSWLAEHRPLPSATLDSPGVRDCAVSVQRTPRNENR